MADWSLPLLSSLYTAWKQLISDRLDDCAKMFDGVTATNLPAGTKRWSASSSKWEKYNGTNWSDMASVYSISISGNAASATTSTLASDSDKLGGRVPSYYQTALGYTPINKAGDTMTGDLHLYRSAYPTTGILYLGNTGQRFLYYDGSNYVMPNSELYVYGGMVLRANNAKTINSTSLWGEGDISVQSPLVSGSNIKTINGGTLLGSGNVTLVSRDHNYNNVGSLCCCCCINGDTSLPLSPGSTVAGSNLTPCCVNAGDDGVKTHGTSLPGTWRCLGYTPSTPKRFLTLFQRIA